MRRAELELYLLGWGVSTFDSEYIFSPLYHTNARELGGWNGTGFSNGEIDAEIRSLRSEIGAARRNITIAKIWERLKAETIGVPLHNQSVTTPCAAPSTFPPTSPTSRRSSTSARPGRDAPPLAGKSVLAAERTQASRHEDGR